MVNPDQEWILGKLWLFVGVVFFVGGSLAWIFG
jgi:hypothetical protein